jgi:hypothetical protein
MHLQEYKAEEKGRKHAHTSTLACLASPGVERQWAHDVCVNGPAKSGPKRRRSMTSFCRLFLL